METYRCTLHVATSEQEARDTGIQANAVDTFAIEADGVDDARAKVKQKLREQGHTVRAISFTTKPREMVAYVAPKASRTLKG